MTLEQQCCSLELAKRLKELNVKQESLFWWRNGGESKAIIQDHKLYTGYELSENNNIMFEWYSAFTVAELGLVMHESFRTFRNKYGWYYNQHGKKGGRIYGPFPSEADARANCIIGRTEAMKKYVDVGNSNVNPYAPINRP